MRLSQNTILVILICVLLSVLFSIEITDIISIPKGVKKVINQKDTFNNKNNTLPLKLKQKKLMKIEFNAGKNKHL